MDTSIGELIDRVQSLYSKGVSSDDARLSKRHIYSKLKSSRNKLVTQEAKKRQKINDWNFIVLPCVELIKVPNHDCPCIPTIGCDVYRTKYKLPKTLTDLNRHLINYVMNIDSQKLIDETTREAYLYEAGNKYTSGHLKYILENEYLFVYGKNIPRYIKIKLLAEDPVDAYNYPSACKEECIDCEDCSNILDRPFPIDSDLVDTLIEMAAQELVSVFIQMQEDKTNNTSDSTNEQAK
jgi:hypothetical protein